MQEYYFLFALAIIYAIFATFQDLRSREVANWLNFSLIAFALAYRAFYSSYSNNPWFFLYGLLAFGVMYLLAYGFYYTKVFAGGDAKLLMGLGIILPYQSPIHLLTFPLLFVLTLFVSGAIWSLFYSIIIVTKNKKKFLNEFRRRYISWRPVIILSLIALILSILAGLFYHPFGYFVSILSLIPLLFVYTKSLEQSMIIVLPPSKLTEGDWLEKEIKLPGGKTIRKTVHGLSYKDIQLLKKYHRSALIKEGIPFVPAFLITVLLTVLVLATSLLPFPHFFSLFF